MSAPAAPLAPRAPALLGPARPGDVRALAAILADWVDETPWMPRVHSRAETRALMAGMIGQGWVTVARRCGAPVGFIARDGLRIHALYVAPGARGQGLGHQLLEHARAASPALELWCHQANLPAQRFYLREGFVEQGRTDGRGNDEHLPDIYYVWHYAWSQDD